MDSDQARRRERRWWTIFAVAFGVRIILAVALGASVFNLPLQCVEAAAVIVASRAGGWSAGYANAKKAGA